jgi:hypothetical protein
MTNLILHYFHRDEGNWKTRLSVCVQNPAGTTSEEAEEMIRQRLIDREFFYPDRVGLEYAVSRFDWHELDCVENDSEGVEKPIAMTFETLLEKLEVSSKAHLKPIKVHKISAVIPLRLAISWLEFLRDLRQTMGLILTLVRKDSAVLVFRNDEDWNLIEETLRLDAGSGNFDRDLRRSIERALDGVKDIPHLRASLAPLRLKVARFETFLARWVK